MSKVDGKKQGELAEAIFLAEAISRKFIVSKPFGDSSKYDFILQTKNGILKKIQVKSVKTIEKGGFRYRCNTISRKHENKNGYSLYNKKDVDFLACYVFEKNIWYIIPTVKITSKFANFYPNTLDSDGKYEKYKNNWNLKTN